MDSEKKTSIEFFGLSMGRMEFPSIKAGKMRVRQVAGSGGGEGVRAGIPSRAGDPRLKACPSPAGSGLHPSECLLKLGIPGSQPRCPHEAALQRRVSGAGLRDGWEGTTRSGLVDLVASGHVHYPADVWPLVWAPLSGKAKRK